MPELPDVRVDTKSETVEVLSHDGSNIPGASRLDDVFKKMEEQKAAGQAPVVEEKKAPETKVEEKATPPVEVKEEPKRDIFSGQDDIKAKLQAENEAILAAEKAKQDEPKEEEVAQEELQVLPHDKPKTAKRIQKLLSLVEEERKVATTSKQEAADKAAKLAELEKKLGESKIQDPETQKKVDEQLNELSMYRRRYQLEQDPEVKAKFDTRIDSAESAIITTLKRRYGTNGEAIADLIKNEGGWLKFTESSRPVTMTDGKQVPSSEFADLIMQALPLGERKAVEAAMIEQLSTAREKTRFFEEQQGQAKKFFEEQEAKTKQQAEQTRQQTEETKKSIEAWQKKLVDDNPWLRPVEAPVDATPEQKKDIEENNRYTQQLNQLLNKNLNARDIPTVLEVVKDSVAYWQERRLHAKALAENKALKQEVEALKEREKKFKTSARSTSTQGSIAQGSSAAAPAPKKQAKSLDEALALIERGASPFNDSDPSLEE